jgi:enoyl-CoA hydratase
VQGNCLAAGLMFVSSCDLVVAADDARFGSNVTTTVGAADVEVPSFAWLVGERRAKQALWLGEVIEANEALRIGLANWVVPLSDLDTCVTSVAERLLQVPREGLALSKLSFNFMAERQGRRDAAAYHFMAHQVSHSTTEAVALLEERIRNLKARKGS